MKSASKSTSLIAALPLILAGTLLLSPVSFAKQGATDPIPGTSKGTVGTGGGKKSTTPTTTLPPIPSTPVQPLVTGTLTMTGGAYNGSTPACTGTYHIDPYYPTLSLITVDLSASGVSTPDGSPLFITVSGTGTLYPFAGGSLLVNGGSGAGNAQIYCTPGTVITNVTVTDLLGNIVFAGN